jgi:hypothetical protein
MGEPADAAIVIEAVHRARRRHGGSLDSAEPGGTMTRRSVFLAKVAVITLIAPLIFSGARAADRDDEDLPDKLQSCRIEHLDRDIHGEHRDRDIRREHRPECAALASFRELNPTKDQLRCFIIAFRRFAHDLVGHRFTVLSDEPDAGGPGICQIDFFRYQSNTLFRATVDLARHRIISPQVVRNTQPAASPGEVGEARTMAEVGALAERIARTPDLTMTGLSGRSLIAAAGGSTACITDRCIELQYYGNAGTGTAPAAEPGGGFVTFVDREVVATAVVDLTRQIVLNSEVFP